MLTRFIISTEEHLSASNITVITIATKIKATIKSLTGIIKEIKRAIKNTRNHIKNKQVKPLLNEAALLVLNLIPAPRKAARYLYS